MSGFNGKIYFVGMGSGLGPMSIIEKPTNCGRGNSCPGFIRRFKIDILVYLTLFSLLSIELVTLWFNLSLFFRVGGTMGSFLLRVDYPEPLF